MPLHLIKLAVGCESIADFKSYLSERMRSAKARGEKQQHIHVTRMVPKRDVELLDGGSLYWVIRGEIALREKLIAIEPFRDGEGINRCRLILEPKPVTVAPRPLRPFQGWRYLTDKDAPPDLGKAAASIEAMPEPMRRELRELGLL
ncbi:MAG: DUF1489 domain-containing protein [Hyphomicrobiales bacterium]|jgi:hypothetical protein|nr:DUF1489 domain-containing protein [Hyphomicrobiales bacterium]